MRCFIAITLPDIVRKQLGELQSILKKYDADINWTRPEGIHLTLKFLGEVPEDKIGTIKSVLQEVCSNKNPFEVEIAGTGIFPDLHRPRVFWIGITQGIEQITELAERLDGKISEIGFPKEERKYHPHLTLGRVRSPKNLGKLTNEFLQKMKPSLGKIQVDHISLYQSKLKPTGAEYINLFQSALIR